MDRNYAIKRQHGENNDDIKKYCKIWLHYLKKKTKQKVIKCTQMKTILIKHDVLIRDISPLQ